MKKITNLFRWLFNYIKKLMTPTIIININVEADNLTIIKIDHKD